METFLSVFTLDFFNATIRMASPIILAAIGEVMLERAGIFNLGIEAVMLFGAFFGVLGSAYSGSAWFGVLLAIVIGAIAGLIYGWAVISINANQAVTGTALNILALGLTSLLARIIWGVRAVPLEVDSIGVWPIPILSNIPFIGKIFFNHSPLVYFSYIMVAVVAFILYKTSWGLKIRAIGENPKAADTMGINVFGWKYAMSVVACCFAAIAGAMLSISFMNLFVDNISAGRGYMAVACVILGQWSPWGCVAGGLIFGAGNALQMRLQAFGLPISNDLILIFPMVLALIVVLSVRGAASARPMALSKPYYKN
jgi:ABC-type uncharacterized transport system permease subunit